MNTFLIKSYRSLRYAAICISCLFILAFLSRHNNKTVPQPNRPRSTSSPKASIEAKKARWEYFHRMLRDPSTNEIPPGIRQKELEFAHSLLNMRKAVCVSTDSIFTWSEVGPVDISGRTRALAVDIDSSEIILAGAVSGGIWRSTDGGSTWYLRNTPTQDLSVTSLAQDPRPGHTSTWYYTTGEYASNSACDKGWRALFTGTGLYKSTDDGLTWQVLPNTIADPTISPDSYFDHVARIVVNPQTGTIFIASNEYGICRSDNGGNSFELVLGGQNDHYWADVVVNSEGTVIAALSQYGWNYAPTNLPGIYKSTNDGQTGSWTNITPPTFPQEHQRSVLATAPSNKDIVYVLTNTGSIDVNNIEDIRLHKINISTGTSEDRSANMPYFSYCGRFNPFSNYCMALAVKPDDENFLLAGMTNLYRSFNGFLTKPADKDSFKVWIGGYWPGYGYAIYPNLHCDLHAIAFDPKNPNSVWFGHDGGLSYASDIRDTSYTSATLFPWINTNNTYHTTQFYTVTIDDEAGDEKIMGGTQDNGTPYFRWDGSTTTSSSDVSGGDGAYCYFGNQFAYTSSQNGRILRFGYNQIKDPSWNLLSEITPLGSTNQLFINPFAIDPNDENIMYYPAGNTLWRNNQLGSIPYYQYGTAFGWTQLTSITIPAGYIISAISISNNNPSHVLYYGASGDIYNTNINYKNFAPLIYHLPDANTSTSSAVDISIPNAANGAYVHAIAVNPDDGNEILVVLSNYNIIGLYHSADGGQNYTAVEGNLIGDSNNPGPSLRSATILPTEKGTVYLLGTSTGLYSTMTLNGSSTVWTQEAFQKMGNVVVDYITSRKSDGRVAVGTHGRGIFIGDPKTSVLVNRDYSYRQMTYTLDQNFPNPFNVLTTITYTIPKSEHVQLKIHDTIGREVVTLVNEQQTSGKHNIQFDAQGMASGIYIYRLIAGKHTETKKLTLLK
jgi:hypothetical protein